MLRTRTGARTPISSPFQDHLGRLVTLHAKFGEAASLLFLDMVTDKVVTTRHLVDAVGPGAASSKCRWVEGWATPPDSWPTARGGSTWWTSA